MSKIDEYHQRLGGNGGPLGSAAEPERSEPWGGFSRPFQRGQILFHEETGAHALAGPALDAFLASGGVEIFGYPLEDTATVAGGQAAYAERGCVWKGPAGTFLCRLEAPLLGRPSMVDPGKTTLDLSIKNQPGSMPIDLFTALWRDRLFLQAVGSNASDLALAVQGALLRGRGRFGLASGATFAQDRQLYNLVFRRTDGTKALVAPHAFYVKRSWNDFGLIHATDVHVALRIESYRSKLLNGGQPEGAERLESPNDRLRDMIRAANRLHDAGSLDAILMTGDLVDFEFESGDRRDGLGNYKVLRELLLGRDPSPDPTVASEELKVPVFTILGNHDYRKNPYQLFANANIGPISVRDIDQYENFNLIEEDAFVIQGRREPDLSPAEALRMLVVDKKQEAYSRFINDQRSYVVSLGQNRIVMLDTRYDAGLPKGLVTEDAKGLEALEGISRDDTGQLFSGSPNVLGIVDGDLNLLKQALKETATGGTVIVGVHGPPIDIKGGEYPWFFRETLRSRPEVAAEVSGFLKRQGGESSADWLSGPGPQPAHFKKGNLTDLVDSGVSRGPTEEFMKLCTGEGSARAADIILCGHGHKHTEYRVKRDQGGFLLHMDFYSENPAHYYNTRSADGRSIYIDVVPGGDMKPVLKAWEPDFAEYWKMATPPYATPLSATKTSQEAKEWWEDHRPIVMQTSSLGLLESRQRVIFRNDSEPIKPPPTFQGYRVFTVQDNTVIRISHVGQTPNRLLRGWGRRIVTRLADIRAGEVSEVRLLQLDATRLLTLVRGGAGQLLLITWSAKLGSKGDGTFVRTGEGAAGKATDLGVAQAGSLVVTSCRNGSGNLFLISWRIGANGAVRRVGDSGNLAGEARMIRIVSLENGILVTACQNAAGNLLLITWRLAADGSFTRLKDSGTAAGEISALALVSQRSGIVVTAVRAGNDRLLLIAWSISANGDIRRLGDSGTQAGEIVAGSGISACVDQLGRVAVSVRADDRLKLILWEVNANGRLIRRGDNAGQVGEHTLATVSSKPDRSVLVSAVTTEAGGLKLITWDVTREGAVRRVPQTGGEAGQASHLSVVAGPLAGGVPAAGIGASFPILTALRAGSGDLMLISWRAVAPGLQLKLPPSQIATTATVTIASGTSRGRIKTEL